jgi:drug/metabolite transporter, DME family
MSAHGARLALAGAALLFSTGGAAIKVTALTSWQTAGFRSLVAALALMALLPEARRLGSWRSWLVGLAYAATLVLFVHATKLTTSANAIFLQATAPAYMLFLGPVVLKEKIQRLDVWVTLLVATGMTMFFVGTENPLATAPNPALGNVYAALTGLTWALSLTGLRWQGQNNLAVVVAGNLLAFLLCAPGALPLPEVTAADVSVILYLGVIQIGLAYWLLTRGLRQVRAFEASLLLMLEPVMNPVWTWLLHGEKPSSWALAGGSVILGGTLLRVWWQGYSRPIWERR